MRAVRNTVDTGRTVVCTIHQPSIDIFDAFNELLLLKRGGHTIYHGPLGRDSASLIAYFTGVVPAVEAPQGELNPATWMLDISAVGAEAKYGVDWADVYDGSELRRCGTRTLMVCIFGGNSLLFRVDAVLLACGCTTGTHTTHGEMHHMDLVPPNAAIATVADCCPPQVQRCAGGGAVTPASRQPAPAL